MTAQTTEHRVYVASMHRYIDCADAASADTLREWDDMRMADRRKAALNSMFADIEKRGKQRAKRKAALNRWITYHPGGKKDGKGRHLMIDDNGTITKGPKALVGAKPSEIGQKFKEQKGGKTNGKQSYRPLTDDELRRKIDEDNAKRFKREKKENTKKFKEEAERILSGPEVTFRAPNDMFELKRRYKQRVDDSVLDEFEKAWKKRRDEHVEQAWAKLTPQDRIAKAKELLDKKGYTPEEDQDWTNNKFVQELKKRISDAEAELTKQPAKPAQLGATEHLRGINNKSLAEKKLAALQGKDRVNYLTDLQLKDRDARKARGEE